MLNDHESKEWDNMRKNLLQYSEDIKTIVRNGLISMDNEGLKKLLKEWKTETLEILIGTLNSIENEDYEICQAVKEVLEERKKNDN